MTFLAAIEVCSACGRCVAWTRNDGACQGCLLKHRTPAQRKVFRAIQRLGPTTIREVAEACGLRSASTVSYHLAVLREIGLVTWSRAQNSLMASSSVPRN